jgi:hypothetical protein
VEVAKWARPQRHSRAGAKPIELEDGAAPKEDLKKARAAAKRLWALAEEARADQGRMVPDGLVPAALIEFFEGIGASRGEATRAAADTVAALCTAIQQAELTAFTNAGSNILAEDAP